MPDTIRFPRPTATPRGPSESDQIITLFDGNTALPQGGPADFVSVEAWRRAGIVDEAPYVDIVLEFTMNAGTPITVGDGTADDQIVLLGQINNIGPGNTPKKYVIGTVGLDMGQTMPQIPLFQNAGAEYIGFSQIIHNVAVYDALAVGGLAGDIAIPAEGNLIITARPIRRRVFIG